MTEISGIQVDYKLKPGCSSRFNQKMFGRISTRKDENASYSYYIPGVLDEIEYCRIFDGRIFIGTATEADFDPILKYCDKFVVASTLKTKEDIHMRTGRQRWKFHSEEKNIQMEWY